MFITPKLPIVTPTLFQSQPDGINPTAGRHAGLMEAPVEQGVSEQAGGLATGDSDLTQRQGEEASLRRLASVVLDSNDAITVQDLDGRITAWNKGAHTMYGYTEAEALRMNIRDTVPEDRREQALDLLRQAETGQIVASLETQRVTKDGRILDVWLTTTKLLDEQGKIVAIATTERDVTKRKKEDGQLRRLASVVIDSNDAITVQDLEGRFEAWNKGAERMYGYTEAEALQMNNSQLVPEAERARALDLVRQIRTGEPVDSLELQRVTKDGRTLDVWLTITKLLDGQKNVVGFATTERDITQRKKAEAALAHLAAIVASSKDAIIGEDPASRIVSWNRGAEQMFGWTAQEAIGQPVHIMHPTGLIAEDVSMMERLGRGEAIEHIEAERRHKDGHPIFVSISLSPILDGAGKVVGAAKIVRDVTERNKLRSSNELNIELERRVQERTLELTAANKDLEAFAYSVSHDLRAPLRSLSGFSQILIDDHGRTLSPEARHDVDMILDSARDMGHLVEDLLAFSRLGRQPVALQAVNMEQLARNVYSEIKSAATQGLRIHFDGLPPAQADPTLLRQVWTNLLGNAIKYSRKKEHPEVTVGWDAAAAAYFVRDNGVGFDMKHADQLFGVFQRLHKAEDYEGTGVGLAIVQRIISRHRGKIWADAQLDLGATFYFTIPGDNK